MACFLVSAAEAVITTVVTKIVEKKEAEQKDVQVSFDGKTVESAAVIPFSKKFKWLNHMLWGGSALLMFEHVWHGEVVPWFPFFTAAADPGDAAEMLHEMATTGVTMALLVTAVWVLMLIGASVIEKRAIKGAAAAK